uniref:Uncharacterized protein n=1 Tax=Klebsiella pneumoniae TaxID=573 RepID=A0A486UEN8_KLEPN|nr:Uncharacterised protein [Klebsiella pneumoniae]
MAESHVVSGLVAKRSEVSGLISHYQHEIARLQGDMQHLDATIKLFDPDYDLRTIRAKQIRQSSRLFANGECHRLMLEALREMDGQGSTGEIALRIHARKGLEEDTLKAVHHGLDAVLRRAASSGLLVKVGRNESGNLWKLADLAQ